MECSLTLAVDLVNTSHEDHDHLDSVEALRAFLEDHDVSDVRRPGAGDLDAVKALRSSLRAVFSAGEPETASGILNRLLADSGANPILTNHDGRAWHLHYSPPGTALGPRLSAETAMALSVVIAEDGYERLRSCDSETCEEVFVDVSRNRSRKYCSQSVCGNRASVRAYRERQRAAQHESHAKTGGGGGI